MHVETFFNVKYEDSIGDTFDDNEDEETVKELIEEHIRDYCKEHKIPRSCITIYDDDGNEMEDEE